MSLKKTNNIEEEHRVEIASAKLPFSELEGVANWVCEKYKNRLGKQVEKFNMNTFLNIARLYRENMPMSKDKWSAYIASAQKSEELQLAIIRHQDTPADVCDELVKGCMPYISVYKELLFSDKKLSAVSAIKVVSKINRSKSSLLSTSVVSDWINSACANIIAKSACDSEALSDYGGMSLLYKASFNAIDDDNIAQTIVHCEDVDEDVLRAICENKNLSDSIRKEAYGRGIDYTFLESTPKNIADDLYEKSISVVFDDKIRNNVNASSLKNTQKTHVQFLSYMVYNNLLNDGQIRNLLSLCGGYHEEYMPIYECVAETTADEDMMKELYKIAKTAPATNADAISGCLLDNKNLPDYLFDEYAKEIFTILSGNNPKIINFYKMASFRDAASTHRISKEIENILMNFDVGKVPFEFRMSADYAVCGVCRKRKCFIRYNGEIHTL